MPIKSTPSKDIVILSYSAYSIYKQCPHRYYLNKIARTIGPGEDRSFTVPGLIVHAAAEKYLKTGKSDGFTEESIVSSIDSFSKEENVDLVKAYGSVEKVKSFTEICGENLNKFLIARNIREKDHLTEAWFGTWDDPLFISPILALQGAPDLIEINDNGTAILYDFKASWSTKNLNKEQLLLYSIACERKFNLNITMTSFFLLPANKQEYFRFTDQDKENLLNSLQDAANSILNLRENLPSCPSEKCKYCQYVSICKEGKDFKYQPKSKVVEKFEGKSFGADL